MRGVSHLHPLSTWCLLAVFLNQRQLFSPLSLSLSLTTTNMPYNISLSLSGYDTPLMTKLVMNQKFGTNPTHYGTSNCFLSSRPVVVLSSCRFVILSSVFCFQVATLLYLAFTDSLPSPGDPATGCMSDERPVQVTCLSFYLLLPTLPHLPRPKLY
jgi:hypothetical protein